MKKINTLFAVLVVLGLASVASAQYWAYPGQPISPQPSYNSGLSGKAAIIDNTIRNGQPATFTFEVKTYTHYAPPAGAPGAGAGAGGSTDEKTWTGTGWSWKDNNGVYHHVLLRGDDNARDTWENMWHLTIGDTPGVLRSIGGLTVQSMKATVRANGKQQYVRVLTSEGVMSHSHVKVNGQEYTILME